MATYDFVRARYYTPGGCPSPRAIVLHMAEGGGTVGWLTHPTNDNSSTFVIEYSGRVVQMVEDGDAAHSLHWDTSHWTASTCGGIFDDKWAKDLLGAAGTADPNGYLIAIEMEGFAKDGPNPAQVKALISLIADLRHRMPSLRGLLGHRDFMGYKACPGCHVFDKVAHGRWPDEETSMGLPLYQYKPAPGFATVKGDGQMHAAIQLADRELIWIVAGVSKPIIGEAVVGVDPSFTGLPVWVIGADDSTELAAFLKRDVDFTPAPPVVDTTSAAKIADLESQVSELIAQSVAANSRVTTLSAEVSVLRAVKVLAVSAAVAIDKLPRS